MATDTGEINKILLEEVFRIYQDAEQQMLKKVAKRVKRGIKSEGWNEVKLKDVQELNKEISKILKDTSDLTKGHLNKGLIKAYEAGRKGASLDFEKIKPGKIPNTFMKDLIPYHLQRLILESQNMVDRASIQILRNTMDVYREVISETNTGVLAGYETRLQASQNALNEFANKGITGFVDKAGRHWELASYVEMATRTGNSHAAIQGHIDRQLELGNDLVIVSSHATTCPICAPWGGKVLSIKGNNPKYPALNDAISAGLFHPNCKHRLTAYFDFIDEPEGHEHDKGYNPEMYEATQKQRHNERMIRMWKRREAVALTDDEAFRTHNKVLQWQAIQREHVNEFGLKRKYGREGISNRVGDPTKVKNKIAMPDIKFEKPKPKIKELPIFNEQELLSYTYTIDGEKVNINEIHKAWGNKYSETIFASGIKDELGLSMSEVANMSDDEAKKVVLDYLAKQKGGKYENIIKEAKEIKKETRIDKKVEKVKEEIKKLEKEVEPIAKKATLTVEEYENLSNSERRKYLDELGYKDITSSEFNKKVISYFDENNIKTIPEYTDLIKQHEQLPNRIKNMFNASDIASLKYERGSKEWVEESLKPLKSKLKKQLGGDKEANAYLNEIVNKVKDADPSRIEWFCRRSDKLRNFSNDGKGVRFIRNKNTINIDLAADLASNKGKLGNIFHEYGHFLDYNIKIGNKKIISKNKDFYNAILEDFKEIEKLNNNEWRMMKNNLFRDDRTEGVQDILSGLTVIEDTHRSYTVKWGHSERYWIRAGKDAWSEVTSEAFAGMNDALFNKHAERSYEKYFPTAYKKFKEIIGVK